MTSDYPRDLHGYGRKPPHAGWPGGARLALQVVLNYEEGGENCILHGDETSECFLSEMGETPAIPDARHMSMESLYEYGSRVGVWRLMDLFERHRVPVTAFTVGMAAERHPEVIQALFAAGHEICSHGYRWINYQDVPEETERQHMASAIRCLEAITGERPLGWYTGRTSPNTRRLVVEEGGFLYDADDYNDDLPWWDDRYGRPQLVIPYTMDCNDMRFASGSGFRTSEQFYTYLKDSFDVLYRESGRVQRMMSVGLHCRIAGRPGRMAALERFFEYANGFADVWWCRRIDIARHWHEHHPPESLL